MEIIKVLKWANTDTEPSTSLSASPPNAPGTVKSGSHSVPNERETNMNTCSLETSSSTTTEGTKNRPKVVSSAVPAKSSKAKEPSRYIRPLCDKSQTSLSRHLSTHVNRGEISKCQIQALVQVSDKGDETHRQEHFKTKAEQIVRYRRRTYRCPLCEFVTAFLTTHLTRKHMIKRASEDMVRIQQMARTYDGKEELDYIKRKKPSKLQMPAKKVRGEQPENKSLADFLLHGEITEEPETKGEESDDLSFHQTETSSGSESGTDESEEGRMSPEFLPATPAHGLKSLRQRAEEAAEGHISEPVKEDISVIEKSHPSHDSSLNEDDKAIESGDEGGGVEADEADNNFHESSDEEDNNLEDDPDADVPRSFEESLKERPRKEDGAKWYLGFYQYLQSLDGKVLSEKHARQHTQQVMILYDTINPDSDMLDLVPKEKGKRIWEYAKPLFDTKKKCPRTILSYLTSIDKFFQFVLDEQLEDSSDMPKVSPEIIKSMQFCARKLAAWRSVVWKRYKTDEWRRDLKAMRTRVTTEDVKDINLTEPAQKAISLLEEAKKRLLNLNEYCLVRDFLIASSGLQNCHRPGAIEALMVEDFQNVERDDKTDTFTVYAPQHTTSTAGPVPLTMSATLFDKLTTFVNDVRNMFKTDSENLLLTQEGKAFNEGTLGRRISSFWKKTGIHPDISMTATRLRKMGTSTTTKNTDAEKWLVHRHMTHTEATANRFYFMPDTTMIAGQGHNVLKQNIGYSDDQESRKDDGQALTEDEKQMLRVMFEDDINANAPLTLKSVSDRLVNSSGLLHLLASETSLKQAVNHLRYTQAKSMKMTMNKLKKQTVQNEEQIQEWMMDSQEAHSFGGRSRQEWDKSHTEELKQFYSRFTVCPDKSQIFARLESPMLSHILAKEGAKRCYHKVKNIYKKRRNESSTIRIRRWGRRGHLPLKFACVKDERDNSIPG